MKKKLFEKMNLTPYELKKIKGGAKAAGCWCTCRCFEATVTGFQIGMVGTTSSGQLPEQK